MVAEHLGVYLRLAAASVRATARRPAHLAARTLAAALIVAIEVAGVMLMLDQFGSIGGWRPAEVVVLFGLGFAGQGLALVFGDTLEANKVSELVRRGTFDQVLTRPASPLGWVVASYVDTRFVGRHLAGVATVVWAADRAGVAWTPGRAGLAALAVASAATIIFGVLMAAAGFTFVTVQGSEAVNVLIYGGQYLASYPMQIYGSALRFLFTWLVPLGLAVYVPALGVLGRQGPPGLPAWLAWLTAPVALAFVAVGGLAWRAGIRHYVGAGS
jgi:ABC-2 type transport system permease protein